MVKQQRDSIDRPGAGRPGAGPAGWLPAAFALVPLLLASAAPGAAQALARDESAELDQRLDPQCQALWREASRK